jgi:hypothetical protein
LTVFSSSLNHKSTLENNFIFLCTDSGRLPKLGLAADAAASGKNPTLTGLKRGTGYRSSFSGILGFFPGL